MNYTEDESKLSKLILREASKLVSPAALLFNGNPANLKKKHIKEIEYNSQLTARLVVSLRLTLISVLGQKTEQIEDVKALIDITYLATAVAFGNVTLLFKQFGAWPLAALQLERSISLPAAVPDFDYTYLLGVKVRRLIKGRIIKPGTQEHKINQSYQLAEAFNRLKRSAIEVSEVFQYDALKGHGKDIGQESEPFTPLQEERFEHTKKYIDLILVEAFKNVNGVKNSIPDTLPPSTAAYGFSRKKGGAAAGVLDPSLKDEKGTPISEKDIIMVNEVQWVVDSRPEFHRIELARPAAIPTLTFPINQVRRSFTIAYGSAAKINRMLHSAMFAAASGSSPAGYLVSRGSKWPMRFPEDLDDKYEKQTSIQLVKLNDYITKTSRPGWESIRLAQSRDGMWSILKLSSYRSHCNTVPPTNRSYTRTEVPITIRVPKTRASLMGAQPFSKGLVPGRRADVCDSFLTRPVPYTPYDHVSPNLVEIRGNSRELTKQYWRLCKETYDSGLVKSQAVPVLEALKVRVITKGEPVIYTEARRLQKRMTAALTRCRIKHFFPSLEGTVTAETLANAFAPLPNAEDDRSTWDLLSGDYKGATDLLRKEVSDYILKQVLAYFPEYLEPLTPDNAHWNHDAQCWLEGQPPIDLDWEELATYHIGAKRAPTLGDLMVKCLTEHNLLYNFEGIAEFGGDKIKEEWEVAQKRGQLMGSNLSFPILNIANLAVNLAFLHEKRVITSRNWMHAPLFVNGDDVLAMAPAGTFDGTDWEDYVNTIGFVKSLGKNFVSPHFCTVNSILFRRVGAVTFDRVVGPRTEFLFNERWRQLGVNEDGQQSKDQRGKRGMTTEDDDYEIGPQLIGRLLHEVLERVTQSARPYILNSFIESNRQHLKDTRRPWYLPGDLGGLGLPALTTERDNWLDDAYVASWLLRQAKTNPVTDFNVAGVTLDSRKCDKLRSQISMKFIKASGFTPYYKIDPTPEDIEISKNTPKVEVDPVALILTGLLPVKATKRPLWKLHAAVAMSVQRARREKDTLRPVELDQHIIRRLWKPTRYDDIPLVPKVPELVPLGDDK